LLVGFLICRQRRIYSPGWTTFEAQTPASLVLRIYRAGIAQSGPPHRFAAGLAVRPHQSRATPGSGDRAAGISLWRLSLPYFAVGAV
jgi:hypothetical protein